MANPTFLTSDLTSKIIKNTNKTEIAQITNSVSQSLTTTAATAIVFGTISIPSNSPTLLVSTNSISALGEGLFKITYNVNITSTVVGNYTIVVMAGAVPIFQRILAAAGAGTQNFCDSLIVKNIASQIYTITATQPAGTSTILAGTPNVASLTIEKINY